MQTHIQDHLSQVGLVKLVHELRGVLDTLAAVSALTPTTGFPELPWLDTGKTYLISCAKTVEHTHTAARRSESIHRVAASELNPGQQAKQIKLMLPILHRTVAAMQDALVRLTSPRYDAGGIFSLSLTDPRLEQLDEVPATSDYIERFFGLASWLAKMNPHQALAHRNLQLCMIEVRVADKLKDLFNLDPSKAARVLKNARTYRKVFMQNMKARKRATDEEKLAIYERALLKAQQKAISDWNARLRLEQLATVWKHLPLEKPAHVPTGELQCVSCGAQVAELDAADECIACRPGSSIMAALAEEAARPAGARERTENQANDVKRKWLKAHLDMFQQVHGCHRVPALEDIFRNADGHASILKDRSTAELAKNVFRCSAHVQDKGSPLNWAPPAVYGPAPRPV
jgi:hypothetical protein